MTSGEGNSIKMNKNYKKQAPYFSSNDTYEVTNFVKGIYYEVLQFLQIKLNFTTTLYRRGDGIWGTINQHENGSYEGRIVEVCPSHFNSMLSKLN